MLSSLLADLGAWNWIVLGIILLIAEIVAPGAFLLWIGIAALLTGALSLQFWGWDAWNWQVQVLLFLALSLASAYIGSRIMKSRRDDSDEPLLNRRAAQLVGRVAVLIDPISEGIGRVRIGDTTWRVKGPDLAAGARVRIVSVEGSDLIVERE